MYYIDIINISNYLFNKSNRIFIIDFKYEKSSSTSSLSSFVHKKF